MVVVLLVVYLNEWPVVFFVLASVAAVTWFLVGDMSRAADSMCKLSHPHHQIDCVEGVSSSSLLPGSFLLPPILKPKLLAYSSRHRKFYTYASSLFIALKTKKSHFGQHGRH